jgi:hypothetical protein
VPVALSVLRAVLVVWVVMLRSLAAWVALALAALSVWRVALVLPVRLAAFRCRLPTTARVPVAASPLRRVRRLLAPLALSRFPAVLLRVARVATFRSLLAQAPRVRVARSPCTLARLPARPASAALLVFLLAAALMAAACS